MRLLRAATIALLCFGFTPGVGELVADGLHALREGHTHHAQGHEDPGPEHGCTGWHHTCSCHASLSIAPVPAQAQVGMAACMDIAQARTPREKGPGGVRAGLDRPPRA